MDIVPRNEQDLHRAFCVLNRKIFVLAAAQFENFMTSVCFLSAVAFDSNSAVPKLSILQTVLCQGDVNLP